MDKNIAKILVFAIAFGKKLDIVITGDAIQLANMIAQVYKPFMAARSRYKSLSSEFIFGVFMNVFTISIRGGNYKIPRFVNKGSAVGKTSITGFVKSGKPVSVTFRNAVDPKNSVFVGPFEQLLTYKYGKIDLYKTGSGDVKMATASGFSSVAVVAWVGLVRYFVPLMLEKQVQKRSRAMVLADLTVETQPQIENAKKWFIWLACWLTVAEGIEVAVRQFVRVK